MGFAVVRQLAARTRPRCRFVFLRSRVCYPLLSAFPSRFGVAVSLWLASSPPSSAFQLARFSPCWAHIGSRTWDCAHAPSHTTGRAVFRIRRLDFSSSRLQDRSLTAPIFVHRFLSEGSLRRSLEFIASGLLRFHRYGFGIRLGGHRSCDAHRLRNSLARFESLLPSCPLSPSALRSTRITRLLRYYGLCCLLSCSHRRDLPR